MMTENYVNTQRDLESVEKKQKTESFSSTSQTLSITAMTESKTVSFAEVHKLWTIITIDANLWDEKRFPQRTHMDLVVVLDHSSSMGHDDKLIYVKANIKHMINILDEGHRFCLIEFNQEYKFITENLIFLTPENKKKVLIGLENIKPDGSTNISDPLFASIDVIKKCVPIENRLSSILLFTDGLANNGLRGAKLLQKLVDANIPNVLTINTFGYGTDHDSKLLQDISTASKGVYYYIESVNGIAPNFAECLAGILSTVAHNVNLRITGQDGCRIINIFSKFPIMTVTQVKDFSISIGSIYNKESKSILVKLSLRKIIKPILEHPLLKIILTYSNSLSTTVQEMKIEIPVKVARTNEQLPTSEVPLLIDKHINRFLAAHAIEEALKLAENDNLKGAQTEIQTAIKNISTQPFSKGIYEQYCKDLIVDLEQCLKAFFDQETFLSEGCHYARSYCAMYYYERSNGCHNFKGITIKNDPNQSKLQHGLGYGYSTDTQKDNAIKAVQQTNFYVSTYLKEDDEQKK